MLSYNPYSWFSHLLTLSVMANDTTPVFPPSTSKAVTALVTLIVFFAAALYGVALFWFQRHLQHKRRTRRRRDHLDRSNYVLGMFVSGAFVSNVYGSR